MEKQFKKLYENVKLTTEQRKDARTKYEGVCKVIHNHFYDTDYNGDTKLIFGSYAKNKRTAIRPISEDQDVDVLFKISQEKFDQYDKYNGNGQSALLQEVREALINSRYSLGEKPKAWGKVILVKTSDGRHNVEVLPALELSDGSFKIPNSESGGSWEIFNPRKDIERFNISNNKSSGLTADLSRIIKRWKLDIATLEMKSYEIENYVIDFLETYDFKEKPNGVIVKDFFDFISNRVSEKDQSHVKTALKRAETALDLSENGNYKKSSEEWRKIFGGEFPVYKEEDTKEDIPTNVGLEKEVATLSSKYPSTKEEYLDIKYGIKTEINPEYYIVIDAEVDRKKGSFRRMSLAQFIHKQLSLVKGWELHFKIVKDNIPTPYEIKWKVRNYGDEAQSFDDLRGEISDGNQYGTKKETAKYKGIHYVECYIIKEDTCVAVGRALVPIGSQEQDN